MHNILVMPNTTPIENSKKSEEISSDCESAASLWSYNTGGEALQQSIKLRNRTIDVSGVFSTYLAPH